MLITAIASYVPERAIQNNDRLQSFGVEKSFLEDKIGVEQTPSMEEGDDTSDMCAKAFIELSQKVQISALDIDVIVVCTQNPDLNGIPHTSAIVHKKIGAHRQCAAFDISLACSGYIYGLSIVTSFMQSSGMKKGLLFTCDPYSKIINEDDKNTCFLFGDAATVTLIENTDKGWSIGKSDWLTISDYHSAVHNNDGFFNMNGQAVLSVATRYTPISVSNVLNGSSIQDIDLFLFHQGSKYLIEHLVSVLKLDPSLVPCDIRFTGNTVSSSIPLLLERHLQGNARKILLCAIGAGLSVATSLIERH